MAKTKVSPIKRLSIPRLELCGAVIVTRLLKHVSNILQVPPSKTFAWTHSSIVLHWLLGNPKRFKTFVGNRVARSQKQCHLTVGDMCQANIIRLIVCLVVCYHQNSSTISYGGKDPTGYCLNHHDGWNCLCSQILHPKAWRYAWSHQATL